MTPQEQHEFEQASAFLFDILPGQWRRLYEGCLTVGFTEPQAMKLVETWIISQGTGDKKAPE